MEGKFYNYVLEELRTLISDLEAGLQPSNIVLHEVVVSRLRTAYDRQLKD